MEAVVSNIKALLASDSPANHELAHHLAQGLADADGEENDIYLLYPRCWNPLCYAVSTKPLLRNPSSKTCYVCGLINSIRNHILPAPQNVYFWNELAILTASFKH